jgi:hypothetical protein
MPEVIKVIYAEIQHQLSFDIPVDATCEDLLQGNIIQNGKLPFPAHYNVPKIRVDPNFIPPISNWNQNARAWARQPGATIVFTPAAPVDDNQLMYIRSDKLTKSLQETAIARDLVDKLRSTQITTSASKTEPLMKIERLEHEVQQLREEIREEREQAAQEREKAAQEREKADQRYQFLMEQILDVKTKRQRLLRRILLDQCREKLMEEMNLSFIVNSEETVRRAIESIGCSPDAVRLLVGSSPIRRAGNIEAHEASKQDVASSICALPIDSSIRHSLSDLFEWCHGEHPENFEFIDS